MQVYAHKKSQKLFLDRWVYGVRCRVIKVSKDYKVIKVIKDNKRKKNGIAITSDRYLDI
jgi:hypothetical protein